MSSESLGDEMLMAYVDGELGEEDAESVRKAVAADAALGRRVAEFAESRRLAKDAYASVLEEEVPERLVSAAISRERTATIVRPRWRSSWTLPLAASIALAAGLGGFMGGRITGGPTPGPASLIVADKPLSKALDTLPSGGETRSPGQDGADGVVRILATYPAGDSLCRAFTFDSGEKGLRHRGIACRRAGTWRVELAVLEIQNENAYATASDRATQSVDGFLDAVGAGEPLDAEAEQQARRRGWSGEQ